MIINNTFPKNKTKTQQQQQQQQFDMAFFSQSPGYIYMYFILYENKDIF